MGALWGGGALAQQAGRGPWATGCPGWAHMATNGAFACPPNTNNTKLAICPQAPAMGGCLGAKTAIYGPFWAVFGPGPAILAAPPPTVGIAACPLAHHKPIGGKWAQCPGPTGL